MKYHIKNTSARKWLEDYKWETDHWTLSWSSDRAKAKLLDRTNIGVLVNEIGLRGCSAFRAEWADRRAPDGVVSMGRRIVRKNGVVRFASDKFRHDNLVPFVGQYIFVEAEDYWIMHPHAFKTSAGFADGKANHICDLDPVEERR